MGYSYFENFISFKHINGKPFIVIDGVDRLFNNVRGAIIYAVENNLLINRFDGKYFFLSNFYERDITYCGITYKNSEAAFQAQKSRSDEIRKKFSDLSPDEAKKLGRSIVLREDWELVKYNKMKYIIHEKFSQNKDLVDLLISTGDAFLEEGNTWNDRCWGTVNGHGLNNLGKILMEEREFWKNYKKEREQ